MFCRKLFVSSLHAYEGPIFLGVRNLGIMRRYGSRRSNSWCRHKGGTTMHFHCNRLVAQSEVETEYRLKKRCREKLQNRLNPDQ